MIAKVNAVIAHYHELEGRLASPAVTSSPPLMESVGREYSAIGKNLPVFNRYLMVSKNLIDAQAMLKSETDAEMIAMAREEIALHDQEIKGLEEKVRLLLVPRDPNDLKNAIVELRAGTGGTEAALFAADLYRMYSHYLENKGWKQEVISASYGDNDGIKEIIFEVTGPTVYGNLKFESGVHRVQRVPDTEAQGRIHTSAASVAVFPETDELELNIKPEELRIDVFRAGGKGGQHVNKTESAVRIVHLSTGIVVTCQDEKSQHKNKAQAMKVLQSRLFDRMQSEKNAKEAASRKSMVSTGDRSAKVRTYNFPQNRVTEHRINMTMHNLVAFMNGDIQDVIDALANADVAEKLNQLGQ